MIKAHKKSRSVIMASRTHNNSVNTQLKLDHAKIEKLAGKDSEALTTELDRAMKVARDDIREFNEMSE